MGRKPGGRDRHRCKNHNVSHALVGGVLHDVARVFFRRRWYFDGDFLTVSASWPRYQVPYHTWYHHIRLLCYAFCECHSGGPAVVVQPVVRQNLHTDRALRSALLLFVMLRSSWEQYYMFMTIRRTGVETNTHCPTIDTTPTIIRFEI